MNPSIILSARGPDIFGAMERGRQSGQLQIERGRQNALADYVKDNGAAIINGDQNALAGYAAYDPQGAMDFASQQRRVQFDQEELTFKRQDRARSTAEALAAKQGAIDAASVAQQKEMLTNTLQGAYTFYEQGDQDGYNAFLAERGLDPAEYGFDQFPAIAAEVEGVLDGIGEWEKVFKPEGPSANDRFKVVGSQLVDLTAEGGPAVVMTAPGQEETIYDPTTGKPIVVRGSGRGVQGKLTEGQSKDVGFATRARGALEILEPVSDSLASAGGRFLEGVSGYDPTGLSRGMQSDEFQKAYQAGGEFLVALLRKDTGAAVTPQEEAYYGRIYLPQPGDGAEVLQQKKLARERAVSALESGMPANAIAAQEEALARSAAAVPGVATPPPAQGGATAPAGLDPADWESMTPEERALFQ